MASTLPCKTIARSGTASGRRRRRTDGTAWFSRALRGCRAGCARTISPRRPERPRPVQLAVGGCKPTPFIEDLAQDESFAGLLIVGIAPALLFSQNSGGRALLDYIAQSREASASPSKRVEDFLRGQAQHLLAYRLPELAPTRAFDTLRERRGSVQNYRLLQPDRCRNYDMSLLKDIDGRRREVEDYMQSRKPMTKAQLKATIEELEACVKRIQQRGGRVLFLRMPSSGSVFELEQKRFPREKYWDALVAGSSADCLHFQDYPELAHYECPEGSHLAYQSATAFTKDLVTVIKREFPDLLKGR